MDFNAIRGVIDVPILFMQFSVYDLLNQWESFGVFDLVLPFLLIFAVVFGVLSATRILGGNNGINIIIALVVAMLALRLDFVPLFFTELFPRLGVALAVILIALILVGIFIPDEKRALRGWFIFFGIVAVLISLATTLSTFRYFNFFGSYFWQTYATTIVSAVLVIAALIGILVSLQKRTDRDDDFKPYVIGPIRTE